MYAELLAHAGGDPPVGAVLRDRFLTGRRQAIRTLWQRAVDRGQVRGEIDVDAVIDVLFGSVIFRLISGHAPISPEHAGLIAEAALEGLPRHQAPQMAARGTRS